MFAFSSAIERFGGSLARRNFVKQPEKQSRPRRRNKLKDRDRSRVIVFIVSAADIYANSFPSAPVLVRRFSHSVFRAEFIQFALINDVLRQSVCCLTTNESGQRREPETPSSRSWKPSRTRAELSNRRAAPPQPRRTYANAVLIAN